MLVTLNCPHCGGKMEVDDSHDKVVCPYCGTEIANIAQKIDITQNVNVSGTVVQKADRSNEPNLLVDFSSSEPQSILVISFDNTKIKRVVNNGQSAAIRLPLGPCTAIFEFAGKKYKRTICTVEHAPVRISVSALGRREIVIDQPEVPQPDGQQPQSQNQKTTSAAAPAPAPRKKASALSIIGFILSFLWLFSVVGIVLAIIDLIKNKDRPHGLSIAAIIVGSVMAIGSIGVLVSGGSSGTTNTPSVSRTNTTSVVETTVSESRIGDTVSVGNFEFTVVNAYDTKKVPSSLGEVTENNFVIVTLKIKNNATTEKTLTESNFYYYRGANRYGTHNDGIYLTDGFWLSTSIGAGLSKTISIVYEIPSEHLGTDYIQVKDSFKTEKIYMK